MVDGGANDPGVIAGVLVWRKRRKIIGYPVNAHIMADAEGAKLERAGLVRSLGLKADRGWALRIE